MKKLFVLLGLLAFGHVALAQQKFSLTQRASPAPGGAAGDIWYASSSTAITRLGIGADNLCLVVSPSTHLPVWASCSSGSVSGAGQNGFVTIWTGDSTLGYDANLYVDQTNHNLGVGTGSSATYRLSVGQTVGTTGGGATLSQFSLTRTGPEASFADIGVESNFTASNNSGSVGGMTGFYSFGQASASGGTLAVMNNYDASGYLGDGIITERVGYRARDFQTFEGNGSVGTQYGVKIEDLTNATTNYSLYTGTAQSYFGGRVGIGVAPSYPLHISSTVGTTGAGHRNVESTVTATAADAAVGRQGFMSNLTASHTSGTLGNLVNYHTLAAVSGSGGTVSNLYSLFSQANVSSGAILGARYGLYFAEATNSGTIGTQYGVYTAGLTAASTNWAIYTDGTTPSYFGGNVGIGATPGAALDVAGKFQVDTNGNIVKLRNVTTSFPSGNTQGVLTNNGSGTLSWEVAGSGPGSTAGMRTLKETVFADLGTQTFTNGNTYTLDGADYYCSCTSCGAAVLEIAASGLRIARATGSGGGYTGMTILAGGANATFASILGEARLRRGKWGMWVRMASYDFSTAGSPAAGGVGIGVYPKWGFLLRSRTKNTNGTPNTATGGIAFSHWLFGTDANPTSYPGVSTADVLLAYVSGFNTVEVYYGTYSGGWPDMDAMTYMGRVTGSSNWLQAANSNPASAAAMSIWFELGGANAASATYEVIFDRWRITSWD